MLTQRCALTVQLQPSMTHIPGLVASMHSRNARHHRNTDHTIASPSHLIGPSRALNTLRLTLIATIPDRAVRSPTDQCRFLASLITIRSHTRCRTTHSRGAEALIDSFHQLEDTVLASITHLYFLSTRNFLHRSIPNGEGGSSPPLLICNDRHSTPREGRNRRPTVSSGLFRYARGWRVAEEDGGKRRGGGTTYKPADAIMTEVAFKLLWPVACTIGVCSPP